MALLTTRQRLARLQKIKSPRVLWKYGSARALAVLENLELKITRPNEFNDPFEWSPGVVSAVSARDVAALYQDPAWLAHWEPPPVEATDPTARNDAYTELARELTTTSREIMAEELDRISAKYGIVCLTKNPVSVLMWSHYADNHRGLAIGIDHRKLGQMPLFPVTYARRRVIFNALTPLRIKPNVRSFEIFLRKNEAWAYEQEYRMIWPLSETIPRRIADQDAYVLPLSPDSIAEVRVGARASTELEDRVRTILERHGSTAPVKRAHLHPRLYKLDFP